MKDKVFGLILILFANALFAQRIGDLNIGNISWFIVLNKNKNKEIKNDCNKIVDKHGKLILPVESVNGILLQVEFDKDMDVKTGDVIKVFRIQNKKRINIANGYISFAANSKATIEIVHFFNSTKVNEDDEVEFVYKKYYGENAGAFIKKYFSDSTFQKCRTIFPFDIEVWKTGIDKPDEIVIYENNSEFFDFHNFKSKLLIMRYKLKEGRLEVHFSTAKGSGINLYYIFEKKNSKYYLVKVIDYSLK